MRLPGLALLAAPFVLIACAEAGGEVAAEAEAVAAAVDHAPQEQSCAGSAAAQLGLSSSEVTAVWASEDADGRATVDLNAGGAVYRCVVDASLNVLDLAPVTG